MSKGRELAVSFFDLCCATRVATRYGHSSSGPTGAFSRRSRGGRNLQPDRLTVAVRGHVTRTTTSCLGSSRNCVLNSCRFFRALSLPALFFSVVFVVLFAADSWAGVGGRVSGTVRDASNAVVANATVTATNVETGVQHQITTNDQGFYSFPDLPIGHYQLVIETQGFKPYQRTGITIDANSALTVDAVLDIGERSDVVTVIENPLQVETTSTQIGEVITAERMTAVPLNGRSLYGSASRFSPGSRRPPPSPRTPCRTSAQACFLLLEI